MPRVLEAAPIREAGTQRTEFLGADREVVVYSATLCVLALYVAVMKLKGIWLAIGISNAVGVWVTVLFLARAAAKKDPLYFRVKWRAWFFYQAYYPARPTPFRQLKKATRRF